MRWSRTQLRTRHRRTRSLPPSTAPRSQRRRCGSRPLRPQRLLLRAMQARPASSRVRRHHLRRRRKPAESIHRNRLPLHRPWCERQLRDQTTDQRTLLHPRRYRRTRTRYRPMPPIPTTARQAPSPAPRPKRWPRLCKQAHRQVRPSPPLLRHAASSANSPACSTCSTSRRRSASTATSRCRGMRASRCRPGPCWR